jgi:uncharacterized RDD family membrane protein YckC
MKCPKCSYLGFETGDRCRNCGYDFSLLAADTAAAPDLPLRRVSDPMPAAAVDWDRFDNGMAALASLPAAAHPLAALPADTIAVPAPSAASRAADEPRSQPRQAASVLPLFQPELDDDEPLIRLPVAPRPPLSVRRTPDRPRFRPASQPVMRTDAATAVAERIEPVLEFAPEPAPEPRVQRTTASAPPETACAPGKRIAAALIDHAILTGTDAAVVYFTMKMAGLAFADWRALPPVPLIAFLGLIKIGYFWAFTLVGGQTIGKMAAGIRVVADDGRPLAPAAAFHRVLVGILSLATFGVAFLPAVLGDRRALHDRVAGTRVVELR